MTKASASHAVDYGFDTRVEPKTLKLVSTAFLLGAQHKDDRVENFHPARVVDGWQIDSNSTTSFLFLLAMQQNKPGNSNLSMRSYTIGTNSALYIFETWTKTEFYIILER